MFHETPRNKTFGTSGDLLDDQGIVVRFSAEAKRFLFSKLPRPAVGPKQPAVQWLPG